MIIVLLSNQPLILKTAGKLYHISILKFNTEFWAGQTATVNIITDFKKNYACKVAR